MIRCSLRAVWALALLTVSTVVVTHPVNLQTAAAAPILVEVTDFGSNPGNLKMFEYVPSGLPAGRPVVVVMHGCTQSAADMDEDTGWTALADSWQVALVFPEQQWVNNSTFCFNSYRPGDQQRDDGEPLSIKQMVDYMEAHHGSDPAKTFVTGLSGGGFMTNVMLAAYPDVFEGGAPMAGGPYKCATNQTEFNACTSAGVDKTPQQWGDLARSGYPGYSGPRPKVMIVHGDADQIVVYDNVEEQMEQWTNVFGTDQVVDATTTVKGYPHDTYSGGSAAIATYTINGMGHAVGIDPGAGTDQCGVAATFVADVNVCTAYYVGTFWGINPTTPPTGATFLNDDADDGYVHAYLGGGAPVIGAYSNNAIGQAVAGRYSRTVLSFDTASLPDGATISRAYIRLVWSSGFGNPWADPIGNSLVVDVKTGCFGVCGIEAGDWSATPTASAVASVPAFISTEHSSDWSAAGRAAINTTGSTQVKLRFTYYQTYINYLFTKSGADAKLMVEYTI